MLRGEDDAALLAYGDAGAGATVGRITPQPDFDENERFPVAANEVDFAATAAKIARQHHEPMPFEKTRGECFGELSVIVMRTGGIFAAHLFGNRLLQL